MPHPLKPPALRSGDSVRLLSLASPIQKEFLRQGVDELIRLGWQPQMDEPALLAKSSYFAGTAQARSESLCQALKDPSARAIFGTRGGYGSNYLIEALDEKIVPSAPKILLGCSDLTSLQIYLWEKFGWVTFYGPFVAMNFCRGAGAPHGYDRASLLSAIGETSQGWTLDLQGESITPGISSGVLLGGCLTLIETTLATPWELRTEGSILVIEDRGMKPYAVDRSLMHLIQAGKFRGVTGVIFGDFPDAGEIPPGDETVRDVALRILGPLGIPIVWGAPIGHTARAMLTLPLGVRARLCANQPGAPKLEILEPACIE